MTPNVYVYVTQLQRIRGATTIAPIRQYGIVPLLVNDAATHLEPQIAAPAKVRPESALTLEVTEKQGRAMSYTVAVVDEGLLGITDYHAPDPHRSFYQREALGVLSWDLYDQVVGAYGAELARLLALGGSESLTKRDNNRERRFPPIVKFLGPFTLAAGAKGAHEITLPPYMGAVRAMVVAGNGRAYGAGEHSVTVTQPLNVLATLPRVLGPGEEFDLPVTLFVNEPPFGQVTTSVEVDKTFTVVQGTQQLNFDKTGEQTTRLRLRVNDRIGSAKVTVRAALGKETARESVHIPVRSANLPTTRVEQKILGKGEEWQPQSALFGLLGTNSSSLTISRAPEFNLDKHLDYLVRYPHGCIEQTVSAAFPQLFLSALVDMRLEKEAETERNIDAAINRLGGFQTTGGGFSYWPYEGDVSPWANNYTGHFLLEAKARGHAVPPALLANWVAYQQRVAREYQVSQPYGIADQAYRLYTLALADQSDAGAMNRLRDALQKSKVEETVISHWMLALAYAESGLADVALELLARAGQTAPATAWDGWYYGSHLRDQGVLLLLRQRLGQSGEAWKLGEEMARALASEQGYNTHATAWSLLALAQTFGEARGKQSRFALRDAASGKWNSVVAKRVIYSVPLLNYKPGDHAVRNEDDVPLYVSLTQTGVPPSGEEKAVSSGLGLSVRFTDMTGAPIAVHSLRQGQDFVAEVTVENPGERALENLALTQVMPSGWQIRNARLEGASEQTAIDYQDLRDDRVLSYFTLADVHKRHRYLWWDSEAPRTRDNRVTLKIMLNASFAGRYYLPGWRVESMYEPDKQASTVGQWVEVTPN